MPGVLFDRIFACCKWRALCQKCVSKGQFRSHSISKSYWWPCLQSICPMDLARSSSWPLRLPVRSLGHRATNVIFYTSHVWQRWSWVVQAHSRSMASSKNGGETSAVRKHCVVKDQRRIGRTSGKRLVGIRVQMRAFSATGQSATLTKQTKIDQCERVRVN